MFKTELEKVLQMRVQVPAIRLSLEKKNIKIKNGGDLSNAAMCL